MSRPTKEPQGSLDIFFFFMLRLLVGACVCFLAFGTKVNCLVVVWIARQRAAPESLPPDPKGKAQKRGGGRRSGNLRTV